MDEFGDSSVDETGISEAIEPHRKDVTSSNPISKSAIEFKEISRHREHARAVDDSSGETPDDSQHGKSLGRDLYLSQNRSVATSWTRCSIYHCIQFCAGPCEANR
jgi:hypothetical protein